MQTVSRDRIRLVRARGKIFGNLAGQLVESSVMTLVFAIYQGNKSLQVKALGSKCSTVLVG